MGSPETCPACSHPPHLGACSRRMGGTAYSCGCLRQTPTPPAPADDASGAEMREACAKACLSRADLLREKSADFLKRAGGSHGLTEARECREAAERRLQDALLCESLAETLRALPLPPATGDATRVPARDDAVEEAARLREALLAQRKAWLDLPACGGTYCDEPDESGRLDCCQDATYHAAGEAIRAIDAALRRAKGGA